MSLRGRLFAATYDWMMRQVEEAGLAAHRQALLRGASGRVLEIGGGTGANLPWFRTATELVLTEPEGPMAVRLERKLSGFRIPARVVRAPAEQLPFEDASFDCVISTLVLCTVGDLAGSLSEARRVLKPGGKLLFLEHVRSDDPARARWQDRLRRPWAWLGYGCQCNRRTLEAIRAAGFEVTELQQTKMRKAAPIVRPLIIGMAAR